MTASGAGGVDWTDAYDNSGYIPGASDYPARWSAAAAAFRASARAELDIAYGPGPRQRFDLFLPEGTPAGLAVFVHGGFWLRFDKSDWSHLAAGSVAAGWAVALPSYTLAPGIRIAGITREVAAAVSAAAARVPGPIRLAGHSAGGHLVTRMACRGTLPGEVAERLVRVVSISGVHDLRLLRLAAMNEQLGIDAAEAATESPILLDPLPGPRITAWVGAQERPEFLRMNRALEEAWAAKGATINAVYEQGRHHFDVVEGLAEPYAILCQAFLS